MIETEKKDEDKKEEEKKQDEAKKPEPEPDEQILKNPSRVLKAQEKVISYLHDASVKYSPVLESRFAGFVVLSDTGAPSEEQELYYDDEERDLDAPNPDLVSDLDIPKAFEFDPLIQNAQ